MSRWVGHTAASYFHSSTDLFRHLSLHSFNKYSHGADSLLYAGDRGYSDPIRALELFTAQRRQKSIVSSVVRCPRTRSVLAVRFLDKGDVGADGKPGESPW